MHRDKTVARILLILSVIHVAAAAPAIVRQRSLDVDEDVRAASEKRGNSDNTPQGLHPVPQMDNDPPPSSGIPQLDNSSPPASGAPHDPPPASGTPQLHGDSLTASETSSVHDAPPSHESDKPPTGTYNEYNHRWRPTPIWSEQPTHWHNQIRPGEILGLVGSMAVGLVGGTIAWHYLLDKPSKQNGRDLTSSSDVVGRGVSTHPRPSRKLVSRALANLRNEDLRLLSALTRRALERLD